MGLPPLKKQSYNNQVRRDGIPAGRKLQVVVRKRPAVAIREYNKKQVIIIHIFMFRRHMVCSRSRNVFFVFRFSANETDYIERVGNG